MTCGLKSLTLSNSEVFECHKFQSVDCHKVKVDSKFHQTYRLFTEDIVVLEHTFDS